MLRRLLYSTKKEHGETIMLKKATWPLFTLSKKRNKIDTNPDYQRPAVWTKAQKQLLIDSILRDFDIPKIYLHNKGNDTYDVVDGQQRIRTIWSFYDDEFPLAKDAEPVNGIAVANQKYSELNVDVASIIDSYNIDFVILDTQNEEEISEIFLRLQNGTTLKAQEKRNAMPGHMRDFVRELTQHEFFSKVDFANTRFAYDLIAAQMTLLALTQNICNIKNADLNRMYDAHKNFDTACPEAKNIKRVLDYLNNMFHSKVPELKRYNIVSLFILIMDMLPNYDIKGREAEIANWFAGFEADRLLDEQKAPEEQDPRLILYHEHLSHSSDAEDSLRYRHNFLKESLLATVPNLPQKDSKRSFDEAQRQVIYRRDNGNCKVCGIHCDWNNWEADHIVPWSRGGKTEIENGQVLCQACNARKSDTNL